MAKLVLLLIALGASVAVSVAQSCGKYGVTPRANRAYDPDGRIVGGVEARVNSWQHIGSMQQYGSHFCGCSLVRAHPTKNETDICITAAHCVYDGTSRLTISAGAHDLGRPTSSQQTVSASKTVYHPQYNPDTTLNDIAIVRMDKPIKFTTTVQPVCLPSSATDVPAAGTSATVAGWGLTREGGSTSDILMQVGVPIMATKDCATQYSRQGIRIDNDAMICAAYPQGGKDACQGDSGGPFITNRNGAYYLDGVVSFGIGCARAGSPGVYAKVANFLPWISKQIQLNTQIF